MPGRRWRGPLVMVAVAALVLGGVIAAARATRSPAQPDPPTARVAAPASDRSVTPGSTRLAGSRPATSPAGRTTAPDCGSWGCAQQARFAAATALVARRPGRLGIVVRDRRTGALWRAGSSGHVMWASSTIKLAVATSLLERAHAGQVSLDATARGQIDAMLHVSDDDAADALWKRYGGAALVARFQRVYGMTGLTFVAGFPRYWGFMKCSAEDLRRLMSYVEDRLDPPDRDHVLGAMRSVGAIQQWGVWAAGPAQRPGTKDGWSIESDPGGKHWCTSAVGFAGPDGRYTVAVMYDVPAAGGSIDAGVHAVSDLVATVFGAPVPAAVTVPDPSTGR